MVPSSSAVTEAVRTSWPLRTQVWSCSAPSTTARTHAYSWTSTRAPATGPTSSTKCRASSVANASGDATPCCLAYANAMFFWVSVGSTADWSPSR